MKNGLCQTCRASAVSTLIDAGKQPVSNRFLIDRKGKEDLFSLALGQCMECGLIQLTQRISAEDLVSPYAWIAYNEPELHLDKLTELIYELPGIGPQSVVGAVTYKDESTLARLRSKGVKTTWCLDLKDLAPRSRGHAGVETLQAELTPTVARALITKYPRADVLLVRHILEHTHDTRRFVEALRAWVRPGGYLVFEVPDNANALDSFDYTRIWEEHTLYFTPATFRNSLRQLGLAMHRFECYEYPTENSLVAIVREQEQGGATATENVEAERQRAAAFAAALGSRRAALRRYLQQHRDQGGRSVIFGAGHLAAMFLNLMGIADLIEFVVDDHPRKQGMFMPGSRLPIKGSDKLLVENIDLCLSSLSPESEGKVFAKQHEFISRGGIFVSIFPSSPRAVDALAIGA